MANSIQAKFDRWRVAKLLGDYPGLTLRPIVDSQTRFSGNLAFRAAGNGLESIADEYDVEVSVPEDFPRQVPTVKETGGRIPRGGHRNSDGTLCLGSPLRQQLELNKSPTLPDFVQRCLIPYLYGFSYQEKHGTWPFGELPHGMKGIREELKALFRVDNDAAAIEMVRLAGMHKRDANKRRCPCGTGRRLGVCHHGVVNELRSRLGRPWFREHHRWLTD